jgi:hypothetical protein
VLRVSIHAGLPSAASRFNRLDWCDIGYSQLERIANYKVVLFEAGVGARQICHLNGYPRWSASLWDLAARALALAYWHAPPAFNVPSSTRASAVGPDGEAIRIDDVTPIPAPAPPIHCLAGKVEVKKAENVGSGCAYATKLCAIITHFPGTGIGGRTLGALIVARDKKQRGTYGMSIDEDTRSRKIPFPFTFAPSQISPTELVVRAALHFLGGDIDKMPPLPPLIVPPTQIIDGVELVAVHRIVEPARTGLLRWLHRQGIEPKPEAGAPKGRVRKDLFDAFQTNAV